jgi:hypothetical protein
LFAALKSGKLSAEDAAAVLDMAGGAADAAQAKVLSEMVNDAAMGPYYIGFARRAGEGGDGPQSHPGRSQGERDGVV